MGRILSYIMFGFFVCTTIISVSVLRSKEKLKMNDILFALVCIGSSIWSFCFGFVWVQENPLIAYYWRCAGMVGTFLYMICAILVIAGWCGRNLWWVKMIEIFPFSAIILYPFLMQKENTIYHKSAIGMTYLFTTSIWNTLYDVYCIGCAVGLFVLSGYMMKKGERKWERITGIRLVFCECVIVAGMLLDTIVPMFGVSAFPGSTLSQFFGALLVYRVYLFVNKNQVKLENVSEFIYYSVKLPMIIYDDSRHLKIANKSAIDFLRLSPYDYEKVTLMELFEIDEEKLRYGGYSNKLDVKCRANDAHCRLDINKIGDEYGETMGYIIIIDDLTDKIRTIEELEAAKRSADNANKAKSVFLAQMSHEIRTPLNTVLGMNEMISRETVSEQIQSYSSYIKDAGKTLLGIINDILDLSKLDAGKTSIINEDYNLKFVVNDIINLVSLKIKEKGLRFKLDLSRDMPMFLHGDALRIKQIIINIMNNAVKYTQKGSITLEVEWDKIDLENIMLIFRVTDTGRGIKKEDIDKIFSPFERVDEQENHTIEGNGLGLSITRKLVNLMNGKINVSSVFGEGSVFEVQIPQSIVCSKNREEDDLSKTESETYHIKAPNAHILVVDDVETNRIVVRELLRVTHINVELAESGEKCLELMKQKKYDMVFLDHMMPGMDGIETLQRLKKMDASLNKDTPIIVMTANAVTGAKRMYLAEGFDDYISKPLGYVELENIIKKYIDVI